MDWYQDVYDFHKKFDCLIGEKPSLLNRDEDLLRYDLEEEEYDELYAAVLEGDVAHIAKEIVDNLYVLIGRAVASGIDLRPVWDAVHQSNMAKAPYSEELAAQAKANGKKIPLGKILKPPDWKPPDIQSIIDKQLGR